MSSFPLKREIEYPSSDGKPFAESDRHRNEMVYLIEGLACHFRDSPDVYVSGNILLYYVEGEPRLSISPDVLVARGLARAKERRDTFKIWEEGRPPCWVMEVTSKKTRMEDLNKKRSLYKRLGIGEYFLYDPRSEYLDPSLQGFRLTEGDYQPFAFESDGALFSQALGLCFRLDDHGRLQILDPKTGTRLLRAEEQEAERLSALEQARLWERARQAREQAQAAEAHAAQLEEELARLRHELERRQG